MHDTQHPTTDDAARAIRDALPAPDAVASERIAQLIADGAPTTEPAAPVSRPARRRSMRRQFGVLRPALAAGAVAIAAGVALLAPSSDPSSPDRGLLELGPDVAAAEALSVAGDAAARAEWHPLRDGEFHHTRSTMAGDGTRLTITVEQWLAADGSGHLRVSQRPQFVPAGERFYVPASECERFPEGVPVPLLAGPRGATLEVGSALPACWAKHVSNPMLANATGDVVAAPPDGARVELPHGPGMSNRPLRFGTEVLEGTKPQPAPPGDMGPTGTAEAPIAGTFTPYQLSPATTWVAVESEPVVVTDTKITAEQGVGLQVPGMPTWGTAFTLAQLEDLSTDADTLLTQLRVAAERAQVPVAPNVPDGVTVPALSEGQEIDHDAATLTLTLDLLTQAPVSPKVRQAAFEVLAKLRMFGEPATVVDGATFPDGSPAFAVEFSVEPPQGFEYPGSAGDVSRMLLDPDTASFRGVVTEFGTWRTTTSYDEPRRVASIPPVDAD